MVDVHHRVRDGRVAGDVGDGPMRTSTFVECEGCHMVRAQMFFNPTCAGEAWSNYLFELDAEDDFSACIAEPPSCASSFPSICSRQLRYTGGVHCSELFC